MGEYQQAFNLYQRVIQISPDYAPAKIGLGTTLNNWGSEYAATRIGKKRLRVINRRWYTIRRVSQHTRIWVLR